MERQLGILSSLAKCSIKDDDDVMMLLEKMSIGIRLIFLLFFFFPFPLFFFSVFSLLKKKISSFFFLVFSPFKLKSKTKRWKKKGSKLGVRFFYESDNKMDLSS